MSGRITVRHLSHVQRQREGQVRFIKAEDDFTQKTLLLVAFRFPQGGEVPLRIPRLLRIMFRLPILRAAAARMVVGIGLWQVRVEE